jgi:hypothetical protein
MSFLNRDHVAVASTNNTAKWDEQQEAIVFSKRTEHGGWHDAPVTQPFAMDIWTAQHGWEWWPEINGSKTRLTSLGSVSAPCPARPNEPKAKQLYSVPIYSHELGGRRDLVVKGKAATEALCDLFDDIAVVAKEAQASGVLIVPVIEATTAATAEFGVAPVFSVSDWTERPPLWGTAIVDFSGAG